MGTVWVKKSIIVSDWIWVYDSEPEKDAFNMPNGNSGPIEEFREIYGDKAYKNLVSLRIVPGRFYEVEV